MTIIIVDKKKYQVCESNNILQNCLSLGIDIPYFCWHPALGSVGACRQCAVIIHDSPNDIKGRIVMSCMTPSLHNTNITVNNSMIKNFRKSILELLMLNHPHDCPVCSEGGSCHLQDMTVMTQHVHRRFRFSKRTYKNQYLGPFIAHEMNRCITCYRCVRFYKDYAQGTDFDVYGISNSIYFGRPEDGMLENEHSGNLIEICPTGVFTDKTNKNDYNRKWDLQYAPTVCHFCSIGCNIIAGERYAKIRKIENRYNHAINRHFICDLGRFGYGFSNLENRLEKPMYCENGILKDLTVNTAIEKASSILKKSSQIIGIGSSRSSIENNYALLSLVGVNNFSCGMLQEEQDCISLILKVLESNEFIVPTVPEIESYDTIIIIGEDISITSPRIALSVRQAIKNYQDDSILKKLQIKKWHRLAVLNASQNFSNSLFITNIHSTKLDNLAAYNYIASISDQNQFIIEVINRIKKKPFLNKSLNDDLIYKVTLMTQILENSKKPLIISGSHSRNLELLETSIYLAQILKKINKNTGIILLTANANSIGNLSISNQSLSIEKSINLFLKNKDSALILMENDLYRYFSHLYVDNIFKKNRNRTIILDHCKTNSLINGGLVFPSTNFFESSGTIINYEGRAQRFFKVYDINFYKKNVIRKESWRWLDLIKSKLYSLEKKWNVLDDIINDCAYNITKLNNMKNVAPTSNFRILGQKIPRSPHRFSGRTSLNVHRSIHESKQPEDLDTMFAFSMEGSNQFNKYSEYIPYIWSPGWNSPQAWNNFLGKSNQRFCSGVHIFTQKKQELLISLNCLSKKNCYSPKKLQVAIFYLLFGSEEMSQYSSLIKQHTQTSYGLINVIDAKMLGINSGVSIQFNFENQLFNISLMISKKFPQGLLGLPLGGFGMPLNLSGKIISNFGRSNRALKCF